MNEMIHCDLAIIGAGAGGLSLASVAAQLGANVVLIESGKMGGDCLNYGCVPSKSLLAAAKSIHHVTKAEYFGMQTKELNLDFSKVMDHVHHVIATISVHDSKARFESLGVRVLQAQAQFIDSKTLRANEHLIQAKRVVIATGSSPFIPPIPGLQDLPYETNESIFNLKQLPQHLIIIGGGPIGCELAQAFAMLGSRVTILEVFKIMPKDDADCVAMLRSQLIKMNIDIHEGIQVKAVRKASESIIVEIEREGKMDAIQGSHLLVATGRRANVAHLALEKAGVSYTLKGIAVDRRLRTSNKKIYAIGDVIGSYQFTHIANYHAGIVLRNILFRLPKKVNYKAVPWVTYTEPELAHVGITAEEASQKTDIAITEWTYAENDRAQAEHETLGKIKVMSTKRGRILGVTMIGAQAGELILPWVVAIHEKKSLRSVTDVIVPYPTFSELSKRVAGEFYAPKLFSKTARWIVKFLLKLG